jgi:hypothetical protein
MGMLWALLMSLSRMDSATTGFGNSEYPLYYSYSAMLASAQALAWRRRL